MHFKQVEDIRVDLSANPNLQTLSLLAASSYLFVSHPLFGPEIQDLFTFTSTEKQNGTGEIE